MKNDIVLHMAPIMGISNRIYRNAYVEHFGGFDCAMAPFIAACNSPNITDKAFKDVYPQNNTEKMKLIPQLLSKTPRGFIQASKMLFGMGHTVINWNLGCPHKRVRDKNRGAGLLQDPAVLASMVKEIAANIPNALSLKVRLGNKRDDELYKLLELIEDVRLEHIIVHPRTGVQMYEGKADLEAFKKVAGMTKHTLVYNGDICTIVDFERVRAAVPTVREFMIGRGAIIDPFLPEEIKTGVNLPAAQKLVRFRVFHRHMYDVYDKELFSRQHLFDKMKELWSYWHLMFPDGEKFYIKLRKTKSLEKYHALVAELIGG